MRLTLLIAVLLAATTGLRAQVTVEIAEDPGREKFLRDESLTLNVRVTNRSGQTLDLGDNNTWLRFTVVNLDGSLVTKLSEVPVHGPFTLQSSQTAHRLVDLMPHYDFNPGRYQITATVSIPDWGLQIVSPPNQIEIIRGTTLWEQVVGVPRKEGPPEPRKFSLQQARQTKNLILYVRLTDAAESRVFKVLPLGQLVSFSRPEPQIDSANHLHVLFQNGARSFLYSVVDTDGTLVRRERHDYSDTRPKLVSQSGGSIGVAGGIRRLTPSDVPSPAAHSVPDDVPVPEP